MANPVKIEKGQHRRNQPVSSQKRTNVTNNYWFKNNTFDPILTYIERKKQEIENSLYNCLSSEKLSIVEDGRQEKKG